MEHHGRRATASQRCHRELHIFEFFIIQLCVVQKTLALVRLGDQPIAFVVIHACATAPTPAAAPANRGDDHTKSPIHGFRLSY